jgi:hypothetical protein
MRLSDSLRSKLDSRSSTQTWRLSGRCISLVKRTSVNSKLKSIGSSPSLDNLELIETDERIRDEQGFDSLVPERQDLGQISSNLGPDRIPRTTGLRFGPLSRPLSRKELQRSRRERRRSSG